MKEKRPRRGKVLPVVLLVLVILIAALLVWQRNNIKALISFITYSQEELEDQMSTNDQAIQDAVNAVPGLDIGDVTEEDRQALRDGTLTLDELLEKLTDAAGEGKPVVDPAPASSETPAAGPTDPPTAAPTAQPTAAPTVQPSASPTAKPTKPVQPDEDYEQKLNELIARAYVLREEFSLEMDRMQEEALAELVAIPLEQRTSSRVAPLVQKYLKRGMALEEECDREMDIIVSEMEQLLRKNGQDLSVVNTIKYTYANEKSLKKAWYMSKLKEKGWI